MLLGVSTIIDIVWHDVSIVGHGMFNFPLINLLFFVRAVYSPLHLFGLL